MEVKPGYKQTEVGVIPEDWDLRGLSEVAQVDPENLPAWTDPNYSFNYISLEQVDAGRLLSVAEIVFRTAPSRARRVLRHNDVLMSTVRPNLKAHLHFRSQVPNAICSTGFAVLRAHSGLADPAYIFAHLFAHAVNKQIEQTLAGSNYPAINSRDVRALAIPCPSTVVEQRAIAAALSDVDALLGGLDRLIAKKRDLKQAAMQQLLTGQTRLPGFSGAWEVKTLGDIVEKIVGGGTPSRANAAFWGNEIPWVTVKDFATFNPWHSQESITRLGLRNSASNLIPAGTLITSTRMALGKAVVYEVDVAINQDLKALFLKPEASVVLLTYWFEHFGNLIDELGSGSTVKGISIGELRRFPFQAPPLPEQTAIAAVLSDMDAELAALEARRDKTRDLKQAMMQELLTGKTRLL